MADFGMPDDMKEWMRQRNWGPHHYQWHFERRWDWYHARAAAGDARAQEAVGDAIAKGYQRAGLQEGQAGNGEDFLFMHRAMVQLLVQNFPAAIHLLRGWETPPQDGHDPDDPVPADPPGVAPNPAKGLFYPKMAEAVVRIEARAPEFATDDDYGLFIQTAMRPVAGDPFVRSPDEATGIHNYLHNRFSDNSSPINIGDPNVNIFNERFWKLHGWIDHMWFLFRRRKNLADDSAYLAKLKHYRDMMGASGHHHHMDAVVEDLVQRPTRNFFEWDFPGAR